jgi:hypothetical protein
VGMLNQFVMTAQLWAQQAPWAALTASLQPALRLLSTMRGINARRVSN